MQHRAIRSDGRQLGRCGRVHVGRDTVDHRPGIRGEQDRQRELMASGST